MRYSAFLSAKVALIAASAINADRLCVGAQVDEEDGSLKFLCADFKLHCVKLASLLPNPRAEPDLSRLKIIDSGFTIAFGDYEACVDALVLESNHNLCLDSDTRSFMQAIIEAMVRRYEIPISCATRRVYDYWSGKTIMGDHMIYHETPDYWAQAIYTGRRDFWRNTGP